MTFDPTSSHVDSPRFIVSANPSLLQQIINNMQADASVNVLEVSGPPSSPKRVVAQMPETKAKGLQQTYGDQVQVEPDQPLTPFREY